jgi:hypothetical protein
MKLCQSFVLERFGLDLVGALKMFSQQLKVCGITRTLVDNETLVNRSKDKTTGLIWC